MEFHKNKTKPPKHATIKRSRDVLLGIHFRELRLRLIQKNCIQVFTAALFVTAKKPADIIPWNTAKEQKRKNY